MTNTNIYTEIMDAIDTLLEAVSTTREYERYRTVNQQLITVYPCINLLFDREIENPTTISAKKDLMIRFSIECYSDDVNADSGNSEAIDIAAKVKDVLRDTPTLNVSGVLDSNSIETENGIGVAEDIFVNIVSITFEVHKRVSR